MLDRDIPLMVPFTPAPPAWQLGPWCIWTAPTGEIICSAVKGGTSTNHWYHYFNGSWHDLGAVAGNLKPLSIHGTAYDDVWAVFTTGDDVQHFDGVSWVKDADLSGGEIGDIFSLGNGDVFVSSYDNGGLWFRRSGAIGAGVWTNEWSQMVVDTGLVYAWTGRVRGVIAFSPNAVYFTIQTDTVSEVVVWWNGSVWQKTSTADKGPEPYPALSGFNGEFWWIGHTGGYGSSKVMHFDGTITIDDQGVRSGVYGSGDLIMLTPSHGYTIGNSSNAEFWLWETTDGGVNWIKILEQNPGLLVGNWMGLALWQADYDPPVITPLDPVDGAVEVEKDSHISFVINDIDSGVDLSTVKLWIDGLLIYSGQSVVAAGWSMLVTPIANGYSFIATPSRVAYYQSNEDVSPVVEAYDLDGNYAIERWTFSTIRNLWIKIYPMLLGSIRAKDEEN